MMSEVSFPDRLLAAPLAIVAAFLLAKGITWAVHSFGLLNPTFDFTAGWWGALIWVEIAHWRPATKLMRAFRRVLA